MNRDIILALFAQSRPWLPEAVAEVPDDRFAEQPAGVVNHPAWTIGHCANALDFARHLLGRKGIVPKEWREHVKPGSTPVADRSIYASKDVLLDMYKRVHTDLADAVREAGDDVFAGPLPSPFQDFSPSIGHMATFMMVPHESYHLGQVFAWRRAAGITPATVG